MVDLFAGAGGLSIGFGEYGFNIIEAVEHDFAAAVTYELNHPSTLVFRGDIADWVRGDVPSADVVVGGPPCQGFSNLGTRRVRDPRNALWRRYVDGLRASTPTYFVLENVADFLRSGQFRDLQRETHRSGRLADYRVEHAILNAADFGAPQLRKRAVIIGSHRDLDPPGFPSPTVASASDWVTVRQAIGDVSRGVKGVDLPDRSFVRGSERLRGPFTSAEMHLGRRPTPLSEARYRSIPPGGNRYDLPDHLLSDCWRRHMTGSGDVMGRLHWDRPAVTIRTEFWKPEKGRYLHPEENRPITHFEASRLQGFPDDYLWVGSKTEIGRQIGNAVPASLGRALAKHLLARMRADESSGAA